MWSDGPAGSADDSRGAVGWVDNGVHKAMAEMGDGDGHYARSASALDFDAKPWVPLVFTYTASQGPRPLFKESNESQGEVHDAATARPYLSVRDE
jgi:hypothetical protein